MYALLRLFEICINHMKNVCFDEIAGAMLYNHLNQDMPFTMIAECLNHAL